MEFFPDIPEVERVEPKATRILGLRAEPYPDGRRLRVTLDLTPFRQRPNVELLLMDENGSEASSASLVEPMAWKLELTLHIRHPNPAAGRYTLHAHLSYPDLGEIDQRDLLLDLPASPA